MDYKLYKAQLYYKHTQDGTPFKKARALVLDGDKIVVLKLDKGCFVQYDLIGGGVDQNETPEQAVVRECKEEVNINVEVIKFLHLSKERVQFELLGYDIDCKRYQYYFICKYVSGETKIEQGNEFENKNVSISRIDIKDIDKIKTNKIFLKKAKQYLNLQ